jgi:hypothetical protein
MTECNSFAVTGTLRLLQRGDITLGEATETVSTCG